MNSVESPNKAGFATVARNRTSVFVWQRTSLSSLQRGMLWTTLLYFIGLSWLPWIGPLLAGAVGGYVTRSWREALAACAPAVVLSYLFIVVIHEISPLAMERWLILTGMNLVLAAGALVGARLAPPLRVMLGFE